MTLITARLVGPNARPGDIAAADVAKIITGLERAIARAAYLVLRAQRRGTGRHKQAIEEAARLTFIGVEDGSFVELLRLPDVATTDSELPYEVSHLSLLAFERLVEAISQPDQLADDRLAEAVSQMATELGIGDRNESITLTGFERESRDTPFASGMIDRAVRQKLQARVGRRKATRNDTVVGVLVEADFENRTARLRLPDDAAVAVKFPEGMADEVHEALRARSTLQGVVRYDTATMEIVSVELRTISHSSQLALEVGAESFWQVTTFADLQAEQRVSGQVDIRSLRMPDLTDDERSAFIEAVAR